MDSIVDSLFSLKQILSNHPMFAAGILLLVGYFLGKVVSFVKLPEITGYIIAGVVMGESVTGVFPLHMGESFTIITEIALGLIALTIGSEFSLVKLRRLGVASMIITVVQILATFAAVTIALLVFRLDVPYALLMGAIATATAPAATVAIVQSLRAKGPFVDYLYGVVALDDAGCVIVFGLTFAFVSGIIAAGEQPVQTLSSSIVPFIEIAVSLAIGIASGTAIHFLTRRKNNANEILIITIGVIFLTSACAIVFHLSPLLTNMAAGSVLINFSVRNYRIFRILEPLTPPVYALFFVIAGTELRLEIFLHREIVFLGLVYIAFRAIGKYGGVYLGCKISRVSPLVKNYLGLCMLPQAGVAIGLVLLIQASPVLAGVGAAQMKILDMMVNIVLLSVFVNELIGPPLSKFAIVKGNEMEE
jgi:Kef-type K+ transport system membrane component KefB